tara:strand:+ start:1359 stop:1868 length:510 start_codon:yes stop_codon:yes gene_type:complete
LQIAVISDLKEIFSGQVEVTCFPFKGDSSLKKWTKKVDLKPLEANTFLTILKNKIPPDSYLEIALKKKQKLISFKNVYFKTFKEIDIPNPELEFETKIEEKEKRIIVTIKSKYFAKGVWISSSSENNFSDNFFDLPILGEKTITLKIKDYEDIYKVIKSLKVKSLWNTI